MLLWLQVWVQKCFKCVWIIFNLPGDRWAESLCSARKSLCNWDLCDTISCSTHPPPLSPVVSKCFSVDLYAALRQALEQVFRRKRVPTMHQLHPEPQLSTAHSHSSHMPFTDRHTSLTRARQTTAQRNKGIERRKRGTTLGISNSSSKALSWKRTQGLSVVR